MSQQMIGQGPGNLVPDSEKKMFLSVGAIVLGDLVALSGATGYSIAAGSATTAPIGIAELAASAAGEWIPVTVSGYTATTITTSGDADAGDLLVAGASGVCTAVAPGSLTAGQFELVVGVATAADATNSLNGCIVYKRV